jgi:antitoxin VapB
MRVVVQFQRILLGLGMIKLSEDVETLARRVAAVERTSVEDTIRRALEDRAHAKGVSLVARHGRGRMTAEQMVALGAEIAELPLLDSRSPREIMDDLSAP